LRIEKRVEQLRKQRLTRPEIASHLGISYNQVRYASQKLVHKGKLRPKTVLVHVYVAFIKQHMSNHPNQPVNAAEIARHLGISREWTRQLYQRVKTE